ncbi:MAG: uncharacterized protein PWQ82_579 [Thermosediminibacterales bacterium]|nr:uncharacterized protein [Thermosediminibacterales bacterium]MDK2835505.1 uncharacterized protein [Thermosediminibacterales bacterium]
MIKLKIERDRQNRILGFSVEGHAGFAPHGQDIVCAAVSALTLTAVLSLKKLLNLKLDFKNSDGLLVCRLPEMDNDVRSKAEIIVNTMLIGIRETKKNYPEYIEVVD